MARLETDGTQPPDGDPRLGTVLGDTYRLVEAIGEGGMASVYRATHARIDRQFAVKILQIKAAQYREVLERFEREAKIGSQLGHDHIVQVVDFNRTAQGQPYLVMDLLQGMDLGAFLQQEGLVPLDWSIAVIRQVASALGAAHEHGVVHRDLKPENIFLCGDPRRQVRSKVMDFGLAKVVTAQSGLTQASMIFGTPWYMAPEQALGRAQEADQRTDLYALGVILYRLLAGKLPFSGPNVPSVVFKIIHEAPTPLESIQPALPRELSGIVAKAMNKEPDGRYGSAAEMMADLQAALGPRWALVLAWGQPPEERLTEVSWTIDATAIPEAESPAARSPAVATVSDYGSAVSEIAPFGRSRRIVLLAAGLAVLIGAAVIAFVLHHSRRHSVSPASGSAKALSGVSGGHARTPAPDATGQGARLVGRDADARRSGQTAPRTGRVVSITSDPAGARLEVNGKLEGTTPAELTLPETDLILSLKKPGYVPLQRHVPAGTRPESLRLSLKPNRSTLTVTARWKNKLVTADVILDGRKVDQTVAVLRGLKPGRHTLGLRATGFQNIDQVVTLKPGEHRQLPVELRK